MAPNRWLLPEETVTVRSSAWCGYGVDALFAKGPRLLAWLRSGKSSVQLGILLVRRSVVGEGTNERD